MMMAQKAQLMEKTGIISYGVAIPSFRLTIEEIANNWGKDPKMVKQSLGVMEKAIADYDEDAVTLGIDASIRALQNINFDPKKINAVYMGSESHPYAVKPSAGMLKDAIGVGTDCLAADLEFACKAGTAAVQIINAFLAAKQIEYGLAVGADTAQSKPGDSLEYTACSAAASFIMGSNPAEIIATIDATCSYTTDTPDFWRAQDKKFPSHAGRFTGQPAYFLTVRSATEALLKKTKSKIQDFDHVVFHMPNASFPQKMANDLGVSAKQLKHGFTVPEIGNPYSASSLVGLASVLDNAKAGDRILVTSYGSGAGADSFALTVTKNIKKFKNQFTVKNLIKNKQNVSYKEYLSMRKILS